MQQAQQLSLPSMMYPHARPTVSPHPQAYGNVEYGSPVQIVNAGSPVYGRAAGQHAPPSMHVPGGRPGRRELGEHPGVVRSALLDEFRANKAGKWELRVSQC